MIKALQWLTGKLTTLALGALLAALLTACANRNNDDANNRRFLYVVNCDDEVSPCSARAPNPGYLRVRFAVSFRDECRRQCRCTSPF